MLLDLDVIDEIKLAVGVAVEKWPCSFAIHFAAPVCEAVAPD
jgi:hypothetical protein